MYSLIIETATERGMIAILEGELLLFRRALPFGLNNSKFLLSAIQEGFNLLNLSMKDLSYVAAGIGPGSYTGIRVAAATAQSIAYALKVPLVGIPTLSCFTPIVKRDYAVLIDAKISGAYLQTAKFIDLQEPLELSDPVAVPLDQLSAHLKGIKTLLTPNSTILKPKLEAIYGDCGWEWHDLDPDPQIMGKIADEKLLRGEVAKNNTLDLLYLRKSQAEEHRNKMEKI